MRCNHCGQNKPERGYCCEKAELETLRAVVDEVTRHLHNEVAAAQTMGGSDLAVHVEHVNRRLRAARSA